MGRASWIFRLFFPSWEFFGSVAPLARTFFRPREHDGSMGPWRELGAPSSVGAPRRALRMLVNPEGNLWLRRRALLDEFVEELAEGEPNGASLAEQWLVASVRVAARESGSRARAWQWGVAIDRDEPVWICPRLVETSELSNPTESTT